MPESWKLTLPCTRAEAEAIDAGCAELEMIDPMPVLVMRETREAWEITAYFERKPDVDAIAALRTLVPSAVNTQFRLENLPDEDWVTLSQQGLAPVTAGRFYVHTAAVPDAPPGSVAFRIEAGQAFGTGGHETTHGCLEMLDALQRRGARYRDVADIGTGTGLLAFAAHHLWPRARVTASDIDPISIAVTRENAAVNAVALGGRAGAVALYQAGGVDHPTLLARAPYDLVIANILAGPLIELAPSLAAVVCDGGTLILAGLLEEQMVAVTAAYRRQGCRLAEVTRRADWPCLRLIKRPRYAWQRPTHDFGGNALPPGDFGSW